MKIAAATLHHYCLPLRLAWATAAGRFSERSGWLLRLETDNGQSGYGDCAPLPVLDGKHLPDAERALREQAQQLLGRAVDEALKMLGTPACFTVPAIRCAIESALLDLLAQAAGQSLDAYLGNGKADHEVAVNAALGNLQRVDEQTIITTCDAGFSIIKLKLGLTPVDEEAACLHQIAALLPAGIQLRLDANRAWTTAEAERFLSACAGLPIEMLEEPLADPQIAILRRLQARCAFPLALDESLPDFDLDALFATAPVRRLVLKPPSLGGLLPALSLAQRARAAGLECIVTSSIDSACGVLAAAHLAAALDNGLAHGLATSGWLVADTGVAPVITGGLLHLPARTGLGFIPMPDRSFC